MSKREQKLVSILKSMFDTHPEASTLNLYFYQGEQHAVRRLISLQIRNSGSDISGFRDRLSSLPRVFLNSIANK